MDKHSVRGFYLVTSEEEVAENDSTSFFISVSSDRPGVKGLKSTELDSLSWTRVSTGAWITTLASSLEIQHVPILKPAPLPEQRGGAPPPSAHSAARSLARMCWHAHTRSHIHTHTRTHAHTRTHTLCYTHMRPHTKTYIHTHIHTYIHTYIRIKQTRPRHGRLQIALANDLHVSENEKFPSSRRADICVFPSLSEFFILDTEAIDWIWPCQTIFGSAIKASSYLLYILFGQMHKPKYARVTLIASQFAVIILEIVVFSFRSENSESFQLYVVLPLLLFDIILFISWVYET